MSGVGRGRGAVMPAWMKAKTDPMAPGGKFSIKFSSP